MVSCGLSVHFHGGAFAQVSLIEKKTQQFADYVRQELIVIIINVSLGSLGCGLLNKTDTVYRDKDIFLTIKLHQGNPI